jgi:hypothetical protein
VLTLGQADTGIDLVYHYQRICRWHKAYAPVYNLSRILDRENYLDTVSLVFGVLAIFLWPIPYAGFPVSIIGLVIGFTVRRHRKSGIATTGIVLSGIGLLITLINLKIGILDIILRKYFNN